MEQYSYINEEFFASQIAPERLDSLLANGWRHFGEYFFRYNLGWHQNSIRAVIPLRIRLADFTFSKSQRRILTKNQDLQTFIRPIEITPETVAMFERHRFRFAENIPPSIYTFLSPEPATVPCEAFELAVYDQEKLLAVSFFDVGAEAISSIYGIFAPEETSRSLGILTMLLEIDFALNNGKQFYYHGYAYQGNSFYDYKKRFRSLEKFDWNGNWKNFIE
ncbi:hypothetical protein BH10ACI1_BH10ACI1_34190 [soil metagenome]